MMNLDETHEPSGGDSQGERENGTSQPVDSRVRELEREIARLQGELTTLQEKYKMDRAVLNAYMIEQFPKTEEELLRLAKEAPTFRELLAELEQKHGLSGIS